jgi:natural product precursor
MKTKKYARKLTLNKKTIADLNSSEMKNAHGGADTNVISYCIIAVDSGCYICSIVIPCRAILTTEDC